MDQELTLREWMAVSVFLVILTSITVFSFSARKGELASLAAPISVRVVGAVMQEQTLSLHPGSSVVDAVSQVSLTEDADIGKLALSAKLHENQVLVIPTKEKTTIFIAGAVEKSGLFLIPEKCRYPDLIRYLPFRKDADLKQFKRRRRFLREGETINIPSTQQEN